MIYFLLCAYNEEQNISNVLNDIKKVFSDEKFCIVLVNDGSTDKTEEIAYNTACSAGVYLPLKILSHEKNLGLGIALKTGFKYIFKNCSLSDITITLDADNTHPIEFAKKMVEKVQAGSDIVIGSRYCPGAKELGVSFTRKFLSRILSTVMSFIFKHPKIKDYTSGYRAYKMQFLLKLKEIYSEKLLTETGFPAATEILLKSLPLNPEIEEVPITLRYDLKKGKSKIKFLPTIIAYLKLILKLKFLPNFS